MSVPRPLILHQPRKLAIGVGVFDECVADLTARRPRRVMVVTGRSGAKVADRLKACGGEVVIHDRVTTEPTVAMFNTALAVARDTRPDVVIGLGGGSPLDVAKLVAALWNSEQPLRDAFGIGKLTGRSTHLVCVPATAGTGSEVSPNAILLDDSDLLKKGVISPHLVPDAAYVDPALTVSVPLDVTAATGVDALTHCIEAYVNKLSHPTVDLFALEGIRLIAKSLARAVENGSDIAARSNVSTGSTYGGLCLGPVNTGAVHALSYPLGGEFHVPHGVANAILLPHVLAFNLPAATEKYASVARALGAVGDDDTSLATAGLEKIIRLSKQCGIPPRLRDVGVPESAIPRLAKSAMTVTRLLDRNVRTVTETDAIEIYRKAM